ncbi:DMT family transporter [Yeosuana sp. MJ-SS3]|uniref:DMT family transporter n=1 Tax=Gilvirhabdus luticola TaxID=3079858 RepID=A0ABU3U6V1_9FLAO|nr:DMT family transporter [Yeosuana sp. MJ-SS3]MDU8886128.1 DMT family transporter [Yeosuana sp. MJ-SS3]
MPNVKLKNQLHLHFLVFIAGFTGILGELISIKAVPLVWIRMIIASLILFVFIKFSKTNIRIHPKKILKLAFAGIIIALHWITFFGSIDASNVSIALTMFSTGAFFASFIEPIVYKRKIIWYEILFGLLVVIGVLIITQSELKYLYGIVLGIFSAFFASIFAVLNGKFLEQHSPTAISFYEFISGVLFITIFMLLGNFNFEKEVFILTTADLLYLFILGSVCTAYAFIAAVKVMRHISPYTVVLTYNLEPVYGIILALLLFPEKEKMSGSFYYGATIIILTVLINGILKNARKLKRRQSTLNED